MGRLCYFVTPIIEENVLLGRRYWCEDDRILPPWCICEKSHFIKAAPTQLCLTKGETGKWSTSHDDGAWQPTVYHSAHNHARCEDEPSISATHHEYDALQNTECWTGAIMANARGKTTAKWMNCTWRESEDLDERRRWTTVLLTTIKPRLSTKPTVRTTLRSFKRLIMTTPDFRNAPWNELQKPMTGFRLEVSYYYCRWRNADMSARSRGRSLL